MRGMILAAGLGTRLKPWTDHHSKALALVNGKSLLQINIEYLQQYGIKQVIVNVHHFASQVSEEIKKNIGWGSEITISNEEDMLLETGGGLKKASWFFKNEEDLVLMNTDILTDMDLDAMITQHQSHQPLTTLAVTNRETSRYFLFNEKNELRGWRNIKTGEERPEHVSSKENLIQKAFSGIHIISTRLFPLIKQEGKFSMVDVYLDLCSNHTIQGFDHSGSKFIDVGKAESISEAKSMFS